MSGRIDERSVETLRRRAERAMDEGRGRRVVEPLLERILKLAPEGDPCRIFAHRHLAELHLEEDPWGAALHLRKVLGAKPHDDVSHSLMALAQALLGNYRAAVSFYRRALALEPRNPWYHHNLGHLLDVALDQPYAALSHLQVALQHADPPEHEITASVAHCLARVGRITDARELAEQAALAAPESDDHRALLAWIERGAPADTPVHGLKDGTSSNNKRAPREADGAAPASRGALASIEAAASIEIESARSLERAAAVHGAASIDGAVVRLLSEHMRKGGFTAKQIARARTLWADYAGDRDVRARRAEVCAAAVHYAMLLVLDIRGVSKAAIADRYGVSRKSVSTRFAEIEAALELRRADPRYA